MQPTFYESFRHMSEFIQRDKIATRDIQNDSNSYVLKELATAFDEVRKLPAVWKWLMRSNHKDARGLRATMRCLVDWPYENVPWMMLTNALTELIKEATEPRDDAYDLDINWLDPANQVGLTPDELELARRRQHERNKRKRAKKKKALAESESCLTKDLLSSSAKTGTTGK
jgi:hypothetical protein